ncbi:MAG: NAD-dependent succinate-semialdehyde dehydrogenase [Planctomycetota bacterium]|jgi:succinate-semialdehyde dehydrogenase/glutarate-semialdehyde dehydrogenase
MDAINPATGEVIQQYVEMKPGEVRAIIDQAHEAFLSWREVPFAERAKPVRKAADVLRNKKDEYAKLMALEMGKAFQEGLAEVEKCAWGCEFYADNAEAFLKDEVIESDATKSFVTHRPLGVVLAVMPWNFPLWQVFRFAAPGLMAGNAGVLKHASNVPGCALAIEEVFRDAGLPENVFRTLLIGSRQVEAVIEHPKVAAVTLTGSTPAGKAVASKAGEMLKKTVLELGGSDPYVILGDADLASAAQLCVASRLINAGQSCIAAKRFIVVQAVRGEFEKRYVEEMKKYRMGDPLEDGVKVGPQAREDLRDDLHRQVEQSVKKGARVLLGGEVPEGPGAYYPPTVLTDVKPGMPAYDEEMFGPVAAIIPVRGEAEALKAANDSIFGLGAAVFTKDAAKGEEIAAKRLDAGCCFVNSFVKSDPRLPFGGIKESGYGRELSHHGIKEFVNIKTVYVK